MVSLHNFFLLIIAVVFFAISGCEQSSKGKSTRPLGATADSDIIETRPLIAKMCPQSEELIKNDTQWATKNGDWRSFTPSSASKILGFLGAQWIGVKIGKIICLYQTNEAVAFPVSLEQLSIEEALEPKGIGWSALANNHKFCKSTNIADCAYLIEPPKNIGNIYKEIEYNPSKLNEDDL